MKKVLFSVMMIITLVYGIQAQNVKFGIKGGLNLPNITAGGTNTPVSEGYESRLAGGFGLFTEVRMNQMFSLRFGVEYSGQGGQKNGMQAMPTQRLLTGVASGFGMSLTDAQIAAITTLAADMPQYYYADVDNTTKFDYIMLPILAQCGWNLGSSSPWRVYVNAGPFVSFLISGKQISKGTSLMYSDPSGSATLWASLSPADQALIQSTFPDMEKVLDEPINFGTTNITGEMKSANFGVTGNVGLSYQCGRNFFFLEVGGNYGFIPVQQDSKNGSNRLGAASVMLGYAFSLF